MPFCFILNYTVPWLTNKIIGPVLHILIFVGLFLNRDSNIFHLSILQIFVIVDKPLIPSTVNLSPHELKSPTFKK